MYPRTKKLPPGYRKVSVIVTDKEYERLRAAAALQRHGTFSEVFRSRLGMQPTPYLLLRTLRQQAETEHAEGES